MADVIINENGDEIDESGTKKKSYAAESMKGGDLKAIISSFTSEFDAGIKELNKTLEGDSLSACETAMKNLITVCSGGPHIEFAKKNNRLTVNPERDKFLTSGGAIGIEEKNKMIYFVIMVQKSTQFRLNFIKFLASLVSDWIYCSYRAIRFEKKMESLYTSSDLDSIRNAFAGFSLLYDEYNSAKIFDTVLVSKATHSQDEITETILDYLDADIQNKPHLTKLLSGARRNNPSGVNTLRVYDRETSVFADIADEEDALKRGIEMCTQLEAELAECYAYGEDTLFVYFDSYQKLIDKVKELLQKAIDIIEAFKTKKGEVPYSIMHYDNLVKDCVRKHTLIELSDPFKDGTNYCEVASDMINRYHSLARTVAKYAPENLPEE